MSEQQRKPRTVASREKSSRQAQWQPASLLPSPDPRDGIEFHWVRNSILGDFDPTNFSRSLKEYWEPCSLKDFPELVGLVENKDGMVEVGGLVLCQRPTEISDQRREYYTRLTNGQMRTVDENLMRENDDRMPLFKERKSKVTFGSGN